MRKILDTTVVTAPFRLDGTNRQQRLAAIQRLDLAVLVDAEDQGPLARRTRTGLIVEPRKPPLGKAPTPLANRVGIRPTASTIALFSSPSAVSTIRARRARPRAILRHRAKLSSSPRSSAVNSIATAGLPMDHSSKNGEYSLTNFAIRILVCDLAYFKISEKPRGVPQRSSKGRQLEQKPASQSFPEAPR